MADATQPVPLNLSDLVNFGQEYQSGANDFGKQVAATSGDQALIYNPFTRSFVQNPNFLTPNEAQALKAAQLEYMAQVDPTVAAELATVHNAATNATQVPGTELGSYRSADGSVPSVGTTYADLAATGASNVPQANSADANSLIAEAQLVKDAYKAYVEANPNQGSGAIHGLLAKIGVGPGATYEKLVQQLGAAGAGLPQLGSDPASVNSLFTAKIAQLSQQYTALLGQRTQPVQQPAAASPSPSMPAMNYSSINTAQPPAADAYTSSSPAMLSPAQTGANAYALSQGR